MVKTVTLVAPKGLLCDFCNRPWPKWKYPCKDFRVDLMELSMTVESTKQAFAACEDCSKLIEQTAKGALLDRCTQTFIDRMKFSSSGLSREKIKQLIWKGAHSGFWANRTGVRLEIRNDER